ncbi:MAG: hypothetical protein IPM96_05150 [Ignavibacteria bacterium]|nr:hypothetical protein [Ignavibacteria bacterium]
MLKKNHPGVMSLKNQNENFIIENNTDSIINFRTSVYNGIFPAKDGVAHFNKCR